MRSFVSTIRARAMGLFNLTGTARRGDPIEAHYDRLEALYLNNGVYDDLVGVSEEGTQIPGLIGLRSLRNPANRVTEFYSAKLDPSEWLETVEYEDEANGDNITDALASVNRWSNWGQEGRTSARQYAWAGDLFEKVSTREDSDGNATGVYYERIDPRYVKDFDKDERGFLTYLLVSTPKTRRNGNETEPYTQTEIWDKAEQRYFVYEHDEISGFSIETMGEPVLEQSLTVETSDAPDGFTGYDFIPVVHAKFRDVGKDRGLPCFGHAIGQIRECDRIATKLHEMLFPDVTWVLQRSGVGPDGNPLPPIELEDNRSTNPMDLPDGKLWARGYDRTTYASGDSVYVGADKITRLPAGGTLEPKIPNRNFQPAIDALAAQVKTLEADLPETAYSKLRELELSGRAIRYSLDDVYSRFEEAFTNLSAAIIRLENMALTIGQVVGLPGFSVADIGEYGENGEAFERTYPTPDPFPSSRQDEAEADMAEANALAAYKALGPEPYRRALEAHGWTEEEAAAEAQSAQAVPQTSIQSVSNLIEQAANGDGNQNPADPTG